MQMILPAAPPTVRPTTHTGFDYSILPGSAHRAVREQTDAIRALLAKTSISVVQIGLRLQFVRDRLGRDFFQPWLEAEFAWSQSVASNYMRAARSFSELDCLEQFQPSALYVLARKKCPPAARAEAIRRARRGERITKALAAELVSRAATETSGPRPVLVERVRKSLLKSLPKLSPEQVEQLARELLQLAIRMRSRQCA